MSAASARAQCSKKTAQARLTAARRKGTARRKHDDGENANVQKRTNQHNDPWQPNGTSALLVPQSPAVAKSVGEARPPGVHNAGLRQPRELSIQQARSLSVLGGWHPEPSYRSAQSFMPVNCQGRPNRAACSGAASPHEAMNLLFELSRGFVSG